MCTFSKTYGNTQNCEDHNNQCEESLNVLPVSSTSSSNGIGTEVKIAKFTQINKRVILCAHKNLCIPQLGICRVTNIYKIVKF